MKKVPTRNFVPALRFNWLTRSYDPLVSFATREIVFKKCLLKIAELNPDQRILDFGIGTGTLSLLALSQTANLSIIGLDVDENILKIAQEKLSNTNIELKKYDGGEFPFSDNQFDKVITSLVFHHLRPGDKLTALGEIFRTLKDEGQLIVADWDRPANPFSKFGFTLLRLFDGWKNTQAHMDGVFPDFMEKAGFWEVRRLKRFTNLLGTITIFIGTKHVIKSV